MFLVAINKIKIYSSRIYKVLNKRFIRFKILVKVFNFRPTFHITIPAAQAIFFGARLLL